MDDFWLWFYSRPNIGSKTVVRMREEFGQKATPEEVCAGLGRRASGVKLSRWRDEVCELKKVLKHMSVRVIPYWSKMYPLLLRQIHDFPSFIFCKGDPTALVRENMVTIVGTRSMTEYGRHVVEGIVRTLTENGVSVVSGLANGVDGTAHDCATSYVGGTVPPVAVLPGGPEDGYPTRNHRLYTSIVEKGCVVWEFVPGTPMQPGLFALRNRILAGISTCSVVIESGEKGGSLITAQSALDNNRDVAAVPGSVFSENSKGTNLLIREGAHVVRDGWDVLSILNGVSEVESEDQLLFAGSARIEQAAVILKCPSSKKGGFQSRLLGEGIEISRLVDYSVLTGSSLAQALTKLEITGILRRDIDGKVKMCS